MANEAWNARPDRVKIGLLGGGQLGTMLLAAAIDLNLDVQAMDDDANAPAAKFNKDFIYASIRDEKAVYEAFWGKELVTIEIENVAVGALDQLERAGVLVYPQPRVLDVIKDKYLQKSFYVQHGIPTSGFRLLAQSEDFAELAKQLPFVQKLRSGGYDGKGVKVLKTTLDLAEMLPGESFAEDLVAIDKELCVIVVRGQDGALETYPVVESIYHPEANMVDYLLCPAQIKEEVAKAAAALAKKVAEALGIVGLLAVELFLDMEGNMLVNEVAPRPHNTGHHTIELNQTSQYHNHWRALLGLPLGSTKQAGLAAMVNIVGADGHNGVAKYIGLAQCLAQEGIFVHLYGKHETRPFRKMGHVTIAGDDQKELERRIAFVKATLKVEAY